MDALGWIVGIAFVAYVVWTLRLVPIRFGARPATARVRPGVHDFLWMFSGATVLIVGMVLAWRFRPEPDASKRLAARAARVALVDGMRSDLAAASEAEKSSVFASTEEDSIRFAEQARQSVEVVEKERDELARLLESEGNRRQQELLGEFSTSLVELRDIDRELLALAVRHTNLQATGLAFGPATQAVEEMNSALTRVAASAEGSPDAERVRLASLGARVAVLHLQTLLAPHIAEASDEKMDALEARMAEDDREARSELDRLSSLRDADPDVRTAAESYARFGEIRSKLLELSRENTNVRSSGLSLKGKREALSQCMRSLDALERALLEEPIPGSNHSAPPNPRKLGGA